ncbi:MAG TPA: TolC family protein [Gemmataceae bacterium]|nr:TolC family protein [Gemmataceae bacterium]
MKRFDRLLILFAVVMLSWLGPLPCRAQPPAPLPTASPAVSQPAAFPPAAGTVPGNVEQPPPSPQPTGQSPLIKIPVQLDIPPQPSQKSPLELPPPPGGETVTLPVPPLEAGDLRFPINLATALRLADARPLIVAAAQASAWVAEAKLQKARVLWIPAFMMNAAYYRHDGVGPDINGGVNYPEGENAFGANSPGSFGKPLNQNLNWFISGVSLYQVVATTDAIFQPLASRQDLDAKRWDIQTAKNEALLDTARSYFNVHQFRGRYTGGVYCVDQGRKLLAAINRLGTDLVPTVEVDRARNLLADLEELAVSERENWRVSSADLTQVLRLDPRAVVEPLEPDHMQITLIDPSRSLDDLMPIGLTNRPELSAQQALIQAALVRIRQEKLRPLLPSILITGFQTPGGMTTEASIFGTGNGGLLNLWSFRDDISTQVVWQLQNMGLGNMALIKKRRAEQSRATAALFQIQDMVAQEITTTQAALQSAAARVVVAERGLRTGLVTFQRNLEGLGQTKRFGNVLEQIYTPQEAVYALKLLKTAFDEYYTTVAQYNIAQFQLFHALGYPARDIEYFRPPDGILPVDTTRPSYLPTVGTGPPPVTR